MIRGKAEARGEKPRAVTCPGFLYRAGFLSA